MAKTKPAYNPTAQIMRVVITYRTAMGEYIDEHNYSDGIVLNPGDSTEFTWKWKGAKGASWQS